MRHQCRDNGKVLNKKNDTGEVMKCNSCKSIYHLLPQCQHSWENMVKIGVEGSSEEDAMFSIGGITIQEEEQEGDDNKKEVDAVDDPIFITNNKHKMIGGFGWHHAIIDTEYNKSVAGDKWTEEYIRALSKE